MIVMTEQCLTGYFLEDNFEKDSSHKVTRGFLKKPSLQPTFPTVWARHVIHNDRKWVGTRVPLPSRRVAKPRSLKFGAGAALQIRRRAKRRGAALLGLCLRSTPWHEGVIAVVTLPRCCCWGIIFSFRPINEFWGIMPRFDWVGREGNCVFYHIFMSVLNTNRWLKEWSGGGIFAPPFLWRGGMERSGKDFMEWSKKRSSLLKWRSVSKSDCSASKSQCSYIL